MKDISELQGRRVFAQGHCRVDYTDPVTGKVLERIEGDNHVFDYQLNQALFQNSVLKATMLLTSGNMDLDPSLPFIPGIPCGYGSIGSTATGIYRGAYRSTDSFQNRISANHVTNMYVYDFLSTQIPRKIGYVGLTAQHGEGVGNAPFVYQWTRGDSRGMYDIEEKRLYYAPSTSLSNNVGGDGVLEIYSRYNVPDGTGKRINVFDLCDRPDNSQYQNIEPEFSDKKYDKDSKGYFGRWNYDPTNKHLCLKLTRWSSIRRYEYINGSSHYYYMFGYRDDIWIFDADGTQVLNHFTNTWQTEHERENSSWQYGYGHWDGNGYGLLQGESIITLSCVSPDYAENLHKLYLYKYDCSTGSVDTTESTMLDSEFVSLYGDRAYYYKNFYWGQGQYYNNGVVWTQPTWMAMGPMYNTETDEVYSFNSCGYSYRDAYYLIEKGLTNNFKNLWTMKEYNSNNVTYTGQPSIPFAYTAYKLPSDAPERPENSAVTIAYGLTINW